jgi:uncharacterized protein
MIGKMETRDMIDVVRQRLERQLNACFDDTQESYLPRIDKLPSNVGTLDMRSPPYWHLRCWLVVAKSNRLNEPLEL